MRQLQVLLLLSLLRTVLDPFPARQDRGLAAEVDIRRRYVLRRLVIVPVIAREPAYFSELYRTAERNAPEPEGSYDLG
jgi:hypothetical protein